MLKYFPHTVQKSKHTKLAGDVSVMTYTGHSVKNTLIRCHFSPYSTTGQVSTIIIPCT